MKSDAFKNMIDNPAPKMGLPDPNEIPRMRTSCITGSHEDLEAHLQKYVTLIKEKGVDDARIVNVRDIPQDPRVLLKCSSPKCPFYGRSGSCPPHYKGTFEEAKEFLNAYTWALVYRVNIPEEARGYISGPGIIEQMQSKEGRHRLASMQRYSHKMGDYVQSAAFYDGHYFAINCHFGPCLASLCEEFDSCQEIKTGICRFPTIAKPSVEQTFCVDLIKLASRLGWQHYMRGYCAYPQDYPKDYTPFSIGLVLID